MGNIRVTDITPPQSLLRLVDSRSVEYLELVESIRDHGVLKPLLVRQRRGKWEIIDGLHRFTAAREVGLETVPCHVVEATDEEAITLAIQANAIAKETRSCEYAAHLRRYLKRHTDLTIAGLSRVIKKSPRWIENCLSLNQLDEPTQTMVNRGEIPLQSAYLLARIPGHQRCEFVDQARALPARDFKQIAAEVIRRWKESVRLGRLQHYFPSVFKPREYLRTLRELRFEDQTSETGIELSQGERWKHPLDGWRAAVKWMLHMDVTGLAEQKRMHAMRERGAPCDTE